MSIGLTRPTTLPFPKTKYGRWPWRGGSPDPIPNSEVKPHSRGWYCRGHPVGEYGAAGLHIKPPDAHP